MTTAVQRARWSRPLVGIASVAVVGAGLGAFFGIRAVQGAGSAPSGGQPPARTEAAMAYDPANGSVVLFGGQSRFSTLNDTWIWNGSAWSQAHPRTSPPPLTNAQMTYDPVSHDVLLVGGPELEGSTGSPIACSAGSGTSSSGSGGSTTTFVPPLNAIPADAPLPPGPTAKAGKGTVVTPPSCATVASPGPATWLWSGSDWSKASATTPFIVFGSAALATDPASGRVVLLPRGPFAVPALGAAQPAIACVAPNPAALHPQVKCPWPITPTPAWAWNGHQWKAMASNVNTQSFELFSSSIVDDAVSGKLATFSGTVAQPVPTPLPCANCLGGGNALQPLATKTGSEALWTGTSWRQVITYDGGPAMPGAVFVGDPATHSDVALSGNGQTWIWTGVWTRAHPGTTPPVVSGAAAVFDAATGQVVAFGGAGTSSREAGLYDQTWTWDGSNWTQRGGSAGLSVVIPVPSPMSIPPCLHINPAPEPVQTAAAQPAAAQPAAVCPGTSTGSIGGGSGSTGGVTGVATGSGAVAP